MQTQNLLPCFGRQMYPHLQQEKSRSISLAFPRIRVTPPGSIQALAFAVSQQLGETPQHIPTSDALWSVQHCTATHSIYSEERNSAAVQHVSDTGMQFKMHHCILNIYEDVLLIVSQSSLGRIILKGQTWLWHSSIFLRRKGPHDNYQRRVPQGNVPKCQLSSFRWLSQAKSSHTLNCLLTLSRSCSKVAALSMAWYLASNALSFSRRIFW